MRKYDITTALAHGDFIGFCQQFSVSYFPKWIFQGFYREVLEQCDLCTWTASTCGALQVQILNPRDLESVKPLENQLGELSKIAQGAIRSQLLLIMISLIMSFLGAEAMQKNCTISSFE